LSITEKTKRLLLSKSGGFCQNPGCNQDLFKFFEDGTVTNIEELAHIIARKKGGPRGDDTLKLSDRDEYDNIILLCPTCHTIVDKSPHLFPARLMIEWKILHEQKIRDCFNVPLFSNRRDLVMELGRLLRENNAIYSTYGPNGMFKGKAVTDATIMWEERSIKTIIPNNRRILSLLYKNEHLLSYDERELIGVFKIHKDGFEYNKLSGDKVSTVPLFPKQILNILKEEG
jgi:hypothetical protein